VHGFLAWLCDFLEAQLHVFPASRHFVHGFISFFFAQLQSDFISAQPQDEQAIAALLIENAPNAMNAMASVKIIVFIIFFPFKVILQNLFV